MTNNRKRILAEALSLDAWHDPFSLTDTSCGVYVELSFKEGRLGGNSDELPFTFKLGLKRALLTIDLETPLEIDRMSVARSVPEAAGELTRILAAKKIAEDKVGGRAALSPAALHLSLSGETKSMSEVSQDDQLKIVKSIPEILVIPHPGDRTEYSWAMEPSWQPTLSGQPWNPTEMPRLRIKPVATLDRVMPAIRVNLSCALEDVHISDIQPKSDELNQKLRSLIRNDINEAAAQQHLKLVLKEADLEPASIDNRFATLIVASILATPE